VVFGGIGFGVAQQCETDARALALGVNGNVLDQ